MPDNLPGVEPSGSSIKIKCARCRRTLLIGEVGSGSFTVKCEKCNAVNLIQVHPQVTIQEVSPALMVRGKVMGVSLPMQKTSVRTVTTE